MHIYLQGLWSIILTATGPTKGDVSADHAYDVALLTIATLRRL